MVSPPRFYHSSHQGCEDRIHDAPSSHSKGSVVVPQLQVYNVRMVRQFRVMWLAVVGVVLFSAMLWGADIVVSTDGTGAFRSIQRAIDAARYGDTIIVNPGVYEETLVLVSGITIRGAGASHTVVRSSYGYQPVLTGTAVGAVLIEDLRLERITSILESVVVDLQSSHITFRNCHIQGGQQGGVRSTGLSTLLFEACGIENNGGYGLQVLGASRLDIRDCRIAENASIGLYLSDTNARIAETAIEWNAWDGIALDGTSSLDVANTTVSNNGRWAVTLADSVSAVFSDCRLSTQAFGNLWMDESASAELVMCALTGGSQGSIEASGTSSLAVQDCQITQATGDGLRLLESATLTMRQTVIANCSKSGLIVETQGDCYVSHATVASNGSAGLVFSGTNMEMSHSIIAANAGVGMDVSAIPGTSQSSRFAFNNVWGNRAGDYVGVHRSASDISVAPEFVNPSRGDWSLSSRSACLEAGEFGSMVGAGSDPRWRGGTQLELGVLRAASDWGTIEAIGRWNAIPSGTIEGTLAWEYPWSAGRAAAAAAISGFTRIRAEGSIEYSPKLNLDLVQASVSPALGISGVLDGAASRWRAWGLLDLHLSDASLRVTTSLEGPTGLLQNVAELSIGAFSWAAEAIDVTLTDMAIAFADEFVVFGTSSDLSIELSILPELELTMGAAWELSDAEIRLHGNTYLKQLATSALTVEWSTRSATQAAISLRLKSGQFEDAAVSVRVQLANLLLTGSLGANVLQGPRCKLGVLVDTSSWFLPRANQSPLPAYSYSPLEPEAGEAIAFDASASTDPDDDLDQIWWDFGDGETAIGLNVEHPFRNPGTYTITLTISDTQGAVTSLVDEITVLDAQTTPVASFTWAAVSESGVRLPRPLRAGDFVLLDAVGSHDPNGAIAEYGWDLQSDGVFDHVTENPRQIAAPLAAGTWPVTLRVVDQDGNSDAMMRVLTIEALKPPEAGFELSPSTPAVGDPIRFIDASVGWDSELISWEWDFGNGHTSREQEPMHRYQQPGIYDVTLTVRDAEGLHDTQSVSVRVDLNPSLVPIQQVWALLIGISDYAEVEDLSYASRDAQAIGSWLVDAGVPIEHIRLLTDGEPRLPESPLDRDLATLVNVREGLGWLRQMAGRDDLVLIHFSGHGYQGADDNLDERDGVDEFFVLHDTRATAKDDTALRDDEFGRFLDRIDSDHVLVFFDSCYSGGLSRSLSPGSRATGDTTDVFSDFRLEGRLVLSASSENQDAFESPQLEHGVLTHFLLNGLKGAADVNADGHITVWELFEYVRSEVPAFVQSERGEVQLPQLLGQGDTRVVLTRAETSPEFSYCPAVPMAGADVTFRSESDIDSKQLHWDFGDGTTGTGQNVIHRFATPGVYVVQLTVESEADEPATKSLAITVSSRATVVSLADDNAHAVISAGRQHGLVLGDQLSLATNSEQGDDPPLEPLLVVEELLGQDTASCRVLQPSKQLTPGSLLIVLPDASKASCVQQP